MEDRRSRPGNQLPAGARAVAGFHRSSLRGGHRSHARRPARHGRRSQARESLDSRRPGDRSFRASGSVRHKRFVQHKRAARVSAQRRALCLFALGPKSVSGFPRGAARYGNLPPGEFGISGFSGFHRPAPFARARLSRHAGGHRLAHHHDQRTGRGRLGRGRNRSRGLHAGPAHLHAAARGSWIQVERPTAVRLHGHRSGVDRDANAAQKRRRRKVRRVLRKWRGRAELGRPRHHRQHGARVRRDHRLFPHRSPDARLSAAHQSAARVGRVSRNLFKGPGAVPFRRFSGAGLLGHPGIGSF